MKKKVMVDGEVFYLEAEIAEAVRLIREGLKLQEEVGRLKEELDWRKRRLAEIGKRRRNGRRSVKLDGILGVAKVVWKQEVKADTDKVEEISAALGPEWMGKFFTRVSEYKPTRDLLKFLQQKPRTAKERQVRENLLQAIEIKEYKPQVKLERKEVMGEEVKR